VQLDAGIITSKLKFDPTGGGLTLGKSRPAVDLQHGVDLANSVALTLSSRAHGSII
jgi:hypothetical protein